jgi:RHS repeat-associated protein
VATEYLYNRNGAMTKDLNKGITEIQYNSLNLPKLMDIKSPVAEARNEYTYSAGGQKLKVVQKWNPDYSTTPVIGSAINTGTLTMTKTTDYVGNKVYENGTLKRILVDGGYIESGTYYFYQTDHLGNNRVVANQGGTAIQKNHYYPFGTAFADKYDDGKNQPYKYNGKELDQMHGLNLYDYSARYYESAIGRFTTVDPLAEKYYSISPYVYCGNNPLRFIDPTGMFSEEASIKRNIDQEVEAILRIQNSLRLIDDRPVRMSSQGDPPKDKPKDPLYYISKGGAVSGAAGSSVKDISGTFRLQGGSNNPKIISYKYYPSGWDGSGSSVTTYSFSKIGSNLAKGAGIITLITETNNMIEAVEEDGGKIGDNTKIQAGKTVGGLTGAYIGAKTGAAFGATVGAAVGVWFGGAGAVPGAAIGSFFFGLGGSIVGYIGGSEIGEELVKKELND